MFNQQDLNRLYAYAMTLCHRQQDAYDLLQQSLELYLCKKIIADNPSAYLRRIIRNQFIDLCRQRKRQPTHQPLDATQLESGHGHMDADIDGYTDRHIDSNTLAMGTQCLEQLCIQQQQLEQIWQLLNSSEHELLYLWALLEMNAREIAEELQLPRGTVLARIHRLRKKILQAGFSWEEPLAGLSPSSPTQNQGGQP